MISRTSVADPVFFNPWIWDSDPQSGMGKNPEPGSGMNNPDLIFEKWSVFWVKKFINSLRGSGSGILSTLDPGWKNIGSGKASRIRNTLLNIRNYGFSSMRRHHLWREIEGSWPSHSWGETDMVQTYKIVTGKDILKGAVLRDRFRKCWRKLTNLGLNKGRSWFLNFSEAPLIFGWNKTSSFW